MFRHVMNGGFPRRVESRHCSGGKFKNHLHKFGESRLALLIMENSSSLEEITQVCLSTLIILHEAAKYSY